MSKKTLIGAALIAGITILGAAAPATAAPQTTVAAAESEADAPLENVHVTLDPATGAVVAVTELMVAPATISGACTSSTVCLRSNFGTAVGFQGSGTTTGSWSNRTSYDTGSWTAQLRWIYSGSTVTGPTLGPGSSAGWGGSAVTVTSVKIF
ncbi:hypothetical protein ASE14_02395 [Agromyces sp. Root81]|uniref:hypothetical protein n=1 Tax=Agromyces sp. Root81 TaxID=1736601 RepID=UPI0006F9279D|nr:hypothetical protein [Agromyces sp. Root81]KRC62693.1 hypothetical protein ASE14_02395 [Agromyces sp. Root81]